jgi:hypothetical protein
MTMTVTAPATPELVPSKKPVRWNARWAELAGVDGHLVTDLVGRLVPSLSAAEIETMRMASIELGWLGDGHQLVGAALDAHKIAAYNGLSAVAATAVGTAELAAKVHISGEPDSREWHDSFQLTMAAREASGHTALAFVVRRYAPTDLVDRLTAVWRAAMGPLREYIPLEPATGDCPCGRPTGDVVFAAEAARLVRIDQDFCAETHRWDQEQIEVWQAKALECRPTHISRDAAGHAIRTALDEAPRLPASTKTWLMQRLGLDSAHNDEVRQALEAHMGVRA